MIIKYPDIKKEIEMAQTRLAKKGSRRNLISSTCCKCRLPFETYAQYPKRTCQLCRFEAMKNRYKFLEKIKKTEEDLYKHTITMGIRIFNKRIRTAKAENCTIKNLFICDRFKPYLSLLETL